MKITPAHHQGLPSPGELVYEPIGVVPASDHHQRRKPIRSSRRVECPYCGSLKAPGAVALESAPRWSVDLACLIGTRSIYCDPCHKRIVWDEVFIGKTPTGQVVAGPFSTSGDEHLAKFLTRHPELAEVEQA